MRKINDMPQRSEEKKPGAIRLTFSYQGESVKLIKEQTLDMIVPPSHDFEHRKDASGFWVEVLDKKRNTIYRRSSENPIKHYAEVRSDDPDRPLYMERIKDPSGIFTILVPDTRRAQDVALFSSAFTPEKKLSPAVEIARFKLHGGQKRKEG